MQPIHTNRCIVVVGDNKCSIFKVPLKLLTFQSSSQFVLIDLLGENSCHNIIVNSDKEETNCKMKNHDFIRLKTNSTFWQQRNKMQC